MLLALEDAGSGVDPRLLVVRVDGRVAPTSFNRGTGRLRVGVGSFARGRHTLVVQASDYQESKNMEDVLRILPNTRIFRTSFAVR